MPEDPVVRRQGEGQETRSWSNVLENLVGTDILKDHDIETKEIKQIDGEEHEVDHHNVNYSVSGRRGEGLAARFTLVELTPSAQAADVVNELSHRHARIEVTTICPLILTRAALLAVSETRTSRGHDYVLGRRLLHF